MLYGCLWIWYSLAIWLYLLEQDFIFDIVFLIPVCVRQYDETALSPQPDKSTFLFCSGCMNFTGILADWTHEPQFLYSSRRLSTNSRRKEGINPYWYIHTMSSPVWFGPTEVYTRASRVGPVVGSMLLKITCIFCPSKHVCWIWAHYVPPTTSHGTL